MRSTGAGNQEHSRQRGRPMNGPFSANDPAPRLVSEVFDKLLADNPAAAKAPPAPLTFIFDGQHSSTPPKMLVRIQFQRTGCASLAAKVELEKPLLWSTSQFALLAKHPSSAARLESGGCRDPCGGRRRGTPKEN